MFVCLFAWGGGGGLKVTCDGVDWGTESQRLDSHLQCEVALRGGCVILTDGVHEKARCNAV